MVQVYSKFDLPYSQKNIPIPSHKEYLIQLIISVEKFVRNLRWRAYFFLNPSERPEKDNYGFKSANHPSVVDELKEMEERLKNMVRDIVFKPYSNNFQEQLKRDLNRIMNTNDVIVKADKTTNHYSVPPDEYHDLLQDNIKSQYRKVLPGEVAANIDEQKAIVNKLDIEDRVMYTPPHYIILY